MANITLAGTLRDPNGDLAVGDKVRFTHKSTTGETVKSASSILTIDPTGVYSVDLEYGLVLVEYKDARNAQFENLGVATVNGTNPATTIPELLNALVPVSSAELIEFQAILADCVAAQVAAEAAAATLDLINDLSQAYKFDTVSLFKSSSVVLPLKKKVEILGYFSNSELPLTGVIIDSSSVTPNDMEIVVSTGVPSIALVIDTDENGLYDIAKCGADKTGVTHSTPVIEGLLLRYLMINVSKGTYLIGDITFTANHFIKCAGRTKTTFNHDGVGAAFKCAGISTARNGVTGFTLNRVGTRDASIGIDTTDSSFCTFDDFQINSFNENFVDNKSTGPVSFSARNSITNFELNSGNTNLYSDAGNANTYSRGRIWNAQIFGMNLQDTQAINFIGVNMESNATQIKAGNGAKASFFGGYIEAGSGNENFDIDDDSHIDFYNPQVNGSRGTFEPNPNTNPTHFDAPDTAASYAKYSAIPAGNRQYIKNPDFSRALNNSFDSWLELNSISVATTTSGIESGTRSVVLTATQATSKYVTQVNIELDVKKLAVGIRLKQDSGTFRCDIKQGATLISSQTRVSVDSVFSTLLVRAEGIDATLGTVITIELSPDAASGTGVATVDQIWCVKGDYVSAPQGYKQSVELLKSPPVLVNKNLVSGNQVDNIAPSDAPFNAVGMKLRLVIQSQLAASVNTDYTFTGELVSVQPVKDNSNVTTEITLNGITATGSLIGPTASNRATYTIELIEWILE